MKKASTYVSQWRMRTRDRMAKAFGYKCAVCGRVIEDGSVLQYHYYDPKLMEEKTDFVINNFVRNPKSWDKIEKEIVKCICLCPICHRYVHANKEKIPSKFIHYEEASEREEQVVSDYYKLKSLPEIISETENSDSSSESI